MLTTTALSLLVSLAAAAVISKQPQQVLVQDVQDVPLPMIDFTNRTALKRLAIEDMSDAKFRLHHHAAKALLGDQSYLLLRTAEMEQRRSEVWDYLWNQNLSCNSWPEEDANGYQWKPKIWLSGGRVFDADPERVPQDVIDALNELSEREWKNRRETRHQSYCNVNQTEVVQHDGKSKKSDLELAVKDSGPTWKVEVPEEYLQYLISDSDLEDEDRRLEEAWKAQEEREKQDILAGRRSVRDMKMPDLSKCEKMEMQFWTDDY